jgi:hypothetical protein
MFCVVEPVKSWFMAASAIHFITLVDSQLGSLEGEFDNCILFLGTKLATFGAEGFDT